MSKEYEFIKQRLGPCGLHCGKCFAFKGGEIQTSSKQLEKTLGNFAVYAKRFSEVLEEPAFAQYPAFNEFLHYLTTTECSGCRTGKCMLFKTCGVQPCSAEKRVDFCFECEQFPCKHTGFDEHLYKRYVAINQHIQKIGIEAYYEEIKDQSRY